MPESRQLAVIMFTDIVGYTGMMQQDEAMALKKLGRYKEKLRASVTQFGGEIIQYFGDGGLIIFSNSADAIGCSAQLQESFTDEPPVPVRIGLHLGDILVSEGNIFGDCVNVASRIESMGIPGSVLVSAPVQQQLRNKPQFKLVSLGHFEFKNVDQPMEIFSLHTANTSLNARYDVNGKFKQKQAVKSIAVLPFVNMSNDPDQEYFSDGIAEEIINSLVHLKDLHVAGRTSSFQFKGKNFTLRQVGKKLAVHHVLEGSLRKQGNRIRITVQLVNVESGYHLWSEKYDREIDDVFAIQDEIALSITEKLLVTLLKKERDLITKSHTLNTEAYDLYLKGRFYLERRGASLVTSLGWFQKAIEKDPEFALAYSGLADANLLLATYGLVAPKRVMAQAKQSAERALQLDPTLCQPYCSLGYYHTSFEWNWAEAKKYFLRSIEINPKYAEGHFRYGLSYVCSVEGKFDEAENHCEIATRLEPLSAISFANYSMILHVSGKFQEALEMCKVGIELDPNSFLCHINAGRTNLGLKKFDDAIESFQAAMKLTNRHHFAVNGLIWNYCMVGQYDDALNLYNELKQRSETEYIAKTFTALSAAYLGDIEEAFRFLEQAYEDRDPILVMIKYERWVPPSMKTDPRFKQIVDRLQYPEEQASS